MNNSQLAQYYRSVATLYDQLAALDQRQAKLTAIQGEQAEIDAARKQVAVALDGYKLAPVDALPTPSALAAPSPALARAKAQTQT